MSNCTIAATGSGEVHVAYERGGTIRHAFRVGGTWTATQIAGAGTGPALALDSTGVPHVSYYVSKMGLFYALRSGDNWLSERVESTGGPGNERGFASDIALQSDGTVHIVYAGMGGQELRHATGTAGSWLTTSVSSTYQAIGKTSIELDKQNGAHVGVFHEVADGDLAVTYQYRCP